VAEQAEASRRDRRANAGRPHSVGMRHYYIVPYGPYLAKDGKYVNVVVASPLDWEVFCRDIGRRPELLAGGGAIHGP